MIIYGNSDAYKTSSIFGLDTIHSQASTVSTPFLRALTNENKQFLQSLGLKLKKK